MWQRATHVRGDMRSEESLPVPVVLQKMRLEASLRKVGHLQSRLLFFLISYVLFFHQIEG
jgi:hypothetical protein